MSRGRKIVFLWGSWVLLALSSFIFPHREFVISGFISNSLLVLLFIISVFIARSEPTRKNKVIFVNFSLFFGTSILFHFYSFIPDPLYRLYFNQYIASGLYFALLAISVVYLALDALFRDFSALQKYIVTLSIVGTAVGVCYAPYIADPMYSYKTEDALNWKELSVAVEEFKVQNGREPTREELTDAAGLHFWRNGTKVGALYREENAARVAMLYPYLHGSNYVILVMTPLYLNTIYLNVLCLGVILLFFGYQYRKDPPQGAYIDKIMFLLFLFCSIEILHAWSFIKSIEWQTFFEMLSVGQYVSTFILLLLTGFFGFRLHFITSAKGEYYEKEILVHPAGITRWRDWLDDLVVAHFFNRKSINGRMFARSEERK